MSLRSPIVFFFIWKFAGPAFNEMMENRQQAIKGDLEAAEAAKTEAESLREDYRQQLAGAREEATRIVEEARQAGESVKADIVAKAEVEARRHQDRALRKRSSPSAIAPVPRSSARSPISRWTWPRRSSVPAWIAGTQQALVDRYIDELAEPRADTMIDEATSRELRIDGYAAAMLDIARAEGDPDGLSDELIRVAAAFGQSEELRATLRDPLIPFERKQGVVDDLLGGRASRVTVSLVNLLVGAGRIGDFGAIAERMATLAAEAEEYTIAEVRTAVELDADPRAAGGEAGGGHRQAHRSRRCRRPDAARRHRRQGW